MLEKFDPAGTAAGQDRQIFAALDALDKLGRLLHDRQVGREVGVEHLVETELAQRRDHFSGADRAGRHAELLADCDADRGGGLDHHGLGRVVQHAPDRILVVHLGQGADRAGLYALAAEDAFGFDPAA